MPSKLSISNAATKMSAEYREIVQKAAGNQTLTTRERGKLESPWAKSTLPAKLMTVDKAMESYIEPKIKKALFAVSTDKKNITPGDAQKLFVTELRASAEGLFGTSSKVAKLKTALDALDVPQLTDYGTSIGCSTFKAQSFAAVMAEISGYEYEAQQWIESKGTKAVSDFASAMKNIGEEEKQHIIENAEPTEVSADDVLARFTKVGAEATKAFKPVSDFKSIRSLSHGIQEDGDTQYELLLAQKKDNSWVAITYSNWPF